MEYLASKNVIHGDLAARNILLTSALQVKITDFGLSKQLYDYTNYVRKQQAPLPWRHMAVESLKEMSFSTESDVWSFGVTMWEVFSLGDVPYPGRSWALDFLHELENGLRLLQPKFASDAIYETMKACWSWSKYERPEFRALVAQLSEQQSPESQVES
jgi:serine/threonine protein kinase